MKPLGDASDVIATINRIRDKERLGTYARRMGMTLTEAWNEPAADIEAAFLVWSLDNARAKLKAGESSKN